MKWPIVLCLLSYACIALGAPLSLCPKSCSCTTTSDNYLEVQCKSTEFLESALPPQLTAITTSLSLNNCGISKIEWNITQFENLKVLRLKSNKLKFINVANLPKSLSYLDLSQNLIKILPEDLTSLINLKKINIFGNPISCTCKSLGVRDQILKKVLFETNVQCDSPKSLHGKSFLSIYCKKDDNIEKLFSGMQGDAPYEGSGFEEEEIVANDENIKDSEPVEPEPEPDIEDEFMLVEKSTTTRKAPEKHEELTTTTLPTQSVEIEGSGVSDEEFGKLINENSTIPTSINAEDEDDDEVDEEAYSELYEELSKVTEEPILAVNMSLPSACNFNCSTPAPLENSNETEVSPAPGLFEAAKMFFNDLDIFDDKSETTTVMTTTTTTTKAADVVKTVVKSTEASFNNDTEAVAGLNETSEVKGKMKSGDVNESSSTYIFLIILLALVIALVVFAIFKRRSIQRKRDARKKKLEEIEEPAEEMKLLKKPIIELNNKPNGTNETVALINGNTENQQNGVEPNDVNLTNGKKIDDEDVEVRKKIMDDTKLLTPEAKRVTVKASEIPNSTPKTPILVTRHLNSDGSIVTTPNSDQQMQ